MCDLNNKNMYDLNQYYDLEKWKKEKHNIEKHLNEKKNFIIDKLLKQVVELQEQVVILNGELNESKNQNASLVKSNKRQVETNIIRHNLIQVLLNYINGSPKKELKVKNKE